ncbi:Putative uncharacterized protein [Escherichia coli D6-117.29]|nr:Putative uncharacterized protein [Escherichia coli D6-117.29]
MVAIPPWTTGGDGPSQNAENASTDRPDSPA